jgi:hypothetical protein
VKPSRPRRYPGHVGVHRHEPHSAPSITVGRSAPGRVRGRHRLAGGSAAQLGFPARLRGPLIRFHVNGSRTSVDVFREQPGRDPELRVPPLPGTVAVGTRLPGALVTPDRGPVSGTRTIVGNLYDSDTPGSCWPAGAGIRCPRSRAATSPPDEIRVYPPDPEVCCPATHTPFLGRDRGHSPKMAPRRLASHRSAPGRPDRPAPRRMGTPPIVVPRTGPTPPGRHLGADPTRMRCTRWP